MIRDPHLPSRRDPRLTALRDALDERTHSWQGDVAVAFDPEAWLLTNAALDIAAAIVWAKGMTAAAASGLIAALPAVPIPMADLVPPSIAADAILEH